MSAGSDSEEEVADLSSPDVTTKYRTAGDIVNRTLLKVLEACVADADVALICELGDKLLLEETGKIYNKKVGADKDKEKARPIEKGIAFPTCVSVNEIVGHFSPFKGETRVLQPGDLVKVDLACHIDGFIAAAAQTILVGGDTCDDRRADVIHAAWTAAEAALRLVQVGNTNAAVTEAIAKSAAEFGCKPMQGVLSHQLKKFVIDGTKVIIGCETEEQRVEEFEFEPNEVYSIDIVMSTGEGKGKEAELRHTVYKRNVEANYMLKTQKARQFISEVQKRFPALPFSLRAIEDEQVARVGVTEAKRHELIEEYPVLKEKEKEFVAQFKFTVLLLPGGTKKITGLPLGPLEAQAATKLSVTDEDLKKLLATSANPKKAKKKKAADGDKKAESA